MKAVLIAVLLGAACCWTADAAASTVPWAKEFQPAGVSGLLDQYKQHCGVRVNNDLFIIGGISDTATVNAVFKSTDDGETWSEVAHGPRFSPRSLLACTVLGDNTIVIAGGYAGDETYLNDVWSSSDNGVTWTQKTASAGWAVRSSFGMVAYDNTLVVMAGRATGATLYDDVWYSTDGGATWTQKPVTGTSWSARHLVHALALGTNQILLIGRHTQSADSSVDFVWYTEDGGGTWSERATGNMLPTSGAPSGSTGSWHSPHVGMLSDGTIFAIGGGNSAGKVFFSHDNGLSWSNVGSLPSDAPMLYGSTLVTSADGIILVSGELVSGQVASPQPSVYRRITPSTSFDEFGGVHRNLARSALEDANYVDFFNDLYDHQSDETITATLLEKAGNDPTRCVFMGAYHTDLPSALTVGAFTSVGNLLTTGGSTTIARPANGAFFYRVPNVAMGFAPSSTISLTPLSPENGDQAETGVGDPGRNYRFSWRMDGGGGGTRVEWQTDVATGSGYNKLLMLAPAGRSCSDSYMADCATGYGVACDCPTASTLADGAVGLVSVSIDDDVASNSITVTVSSNGGALELANREVRTTSLMVKTGDDGTGTCTKYFTSRDSDFTCTAAKCGNDATDPYSCSATITIADLVAYCDQSIHMETLDDGRTGFTLTADVVYEDETTGAFGEAVGTASHTVTSVLHVPAGVSGTLVSSSQASIDALSIQVFSSDVEPGNPGGSAQLDIALNVRVAAGAKLTGVTVTKDVSASYDTILVSAGAGGHDCSTSDTFCDTQATLTVTEAVADCDFTGGFTATLSFANPDGGDDIDVTFTATIDSVGDPSVCVAQTGDGTGGASTSVLDAVEVTQTGVLGLPSAQMDLTWTSSVQSLENSGASGNYVDSTLTEVKLALLEAADECNDNTGATVVYPEPSGGPVMAHEGTSLVSVTDGVPATQVQDIKLALTTAALPQLSKIDTGTAFTSLTQKYTAKVCIVVTRTVEAFSESRRLAGEEVEQVVSARALAVEVSPRAGAAGVQLQIAPPGSDASVTGTVVLATTTPSEDLPTSAHAALKDSVAAAIAATLDLDTSNVFAHGIVQNDNSRRLFTSEDGNILVGFTLVVPSDTTDDVAARTEAAMASVVAQPSTSALGVALNRELQKRDATKHLYFVGASTERAHEPLDGGATSLLQPWMIAAAGAALVLAVALVALMVRRNQSGTGKSVSKVTVVGSSNGSVDFTSSSDGTDIESADAPECIRPASQAWE